jgi:hypothetical protein
MKNSKPAAAISIGAAATIKFRGDQPATGVVVAASKSGHKVTVLQGHNQILVTRSLNGQYHVAGYTTDGFVEFNAL